MTLFPSEAYEAITCASVLIVASSVIPRIDTVPLKGPIGSQLELEFGVDI